MTVVTNLKKYLTAVTNFIKNLTAVKRLNNCIFNNFYIIVLKCTNLESFLFLFNVKDDGFVSRNSNSIELSWQTVKNLNSLALISAIIIINCISTFHYWIKMFGWHTTNKVCFKDQTLTWYLQFTHLLVVCLYCLVVNHPLAQSCQNIITYHS